jgi:hypothetical protein
MIVSYAAILISMGVSLRSLTANCRYRQNHDVHCLAPCAGGVAVSDHG